MSSPIHYMFYLCNSKATYLKKTLQKNMQLLINFEDSLDGKKLLVEGRGNLLLLNLIKLIKYILFIKK